MARLYADENFPLPVVEVLRQLGHDVATAYESGNAGQKIPDETVLTFASDNDRILLTLNRKHFIRLHIERPSHSEHLVRRLQRRIAESDHGFASPENIKMYFCEKGANGSTIQPIEVDRFGQIRNWPEHFFGDITGDLEKMTIAALERSRNGH